jgi:hypothetical protein
MTWQTTLRTKLAARFPLLSFYTKKPLVDFAQSLAEMVEALRELVQKFKLSTEQQVIWRDRVTNPSLYLPGKTKKNLQISLGRCYDQKHL